MKKLLQSIILFFAASLLFTSCSRDISLVKRHYRNGYYVEIGDKQVRAAGQESVIRHEQAEHAVSVSSKVSNHDFILPNKPFTLKREFESEKNNFSGAAAVSGKNKKDKDQLSKGMVPAKMLAKHPLKLRKKLSEIKNASPSSDLGNVIWILIVILLILWLLALLTGGWGLGGLIYVLLVVALVLLILRLLGIV